MAGTVTEIKHNLNKPDQSFSCSLLYRGSSRMVISYRSSREYCQGDIRIPPGTLTLAYYEEGLQYILWKMIGPDLVVEVVSPDDPDRDLRHKRADYAEARIPEYWIVNPIDETVTVLVLAEDSYVDHGVFHRGQQARSVCLSDCSLDVTGLFEAR